MKKFTFLLCLLIASAGFAQADLEDFEGYVVGSTIPFVNGPGTATVIADNTGAGNGNVLEIITAAASAPWQQAELTFQPGFELDLSGVDKTVLVEWYSVAPFDALVRADAGVGGGASAAQAIHPGGGWVTLAFDFNSPQDGLGVPTGVYGQLFFFNLWDAPDVDMDNIPDGNGGWVCGAPDCSPSVTTLVNLVQGPESVAETCSDGILNNGELDVDCGGPNCAPCPVVETCTDGIQNNGETDVDCGGPNCTPCNPNFLILEDFEGIDPPLAFVNGPGSATVLADPTGGSNNGDVLEIITAAASAPWQQAELTLQDDMLDLSTANKTVFVEWYSMTPFDALIRASAPISGADSAAQAIHPGGGWATLEFDFNSPQDGLGVPNGVYGKIYFFQLWDAPDANMDNIPDGNGTWVCGAPDCSTITTTYIDIVQGPDITGPTCTTTLGSTSATCDTTGPGATDDTYTATVDFSDGLNGNVYIVTASSGTVGGDDPNAVASGTITVTGITEGTNITVTVDDTADGGSCSLSANITSPMCIPPPSLTLLEDFEGSPEVTTSNGLGAANVIPDPLNGSNTVLEIISADSGESWQQANVIMQDYFMDLSSNVTIEVDVYATQDFSMLVRLDDLINAPAAAPTASELSYATLNGAWQTLTFTFDQIVDGQNLPNGEYSQIAFFPNWAIGGWNPPENFTVYVDNIRAVQGSEIPVLPVNYVYNDGWAPSDPTGVSGAIDNINIINGDLVVSADLECQDLTMQAGTSMTINSGVTVTTSSTTLFSQTTSFPSLIVDGTITGTVNYHRMTAIVGTNDLASPPLSGQTFGPFAGANLNLPQQGDLRAYGPYDTVAGEYVNYDITANAGTVLQSGVGYRAATIDGNRLIYTGSPLSSDVLDIPITDAVAGKAWNLIGNPYSSYLDFDTFFNLNLSQFDSAGPFQAIYGYDGSATNGWVVWNLATIADSEVTELIAPGQGFFVKSQAGGGLVDYTTSMRRSGSSDDFIQGRAASSLDVALTKLSLTSSTDAAKTRIYFIEGTSRGLDSGYDAGAYGGNGEAGFTIFTNLVEENEGLDIAIQSLPYFDFNDIIVPVGVKALAGTVLTIGLEENLYSPVPANVNIYLEDTLENTLTLLNTSDYTFTPTTDMVGAGRFFLRYSADTLSLNPNETLNELVIYTNENHEDIIIKGMLTEATDATLYDIQGRLVLNEKLEQSNITNTIDVSSISSGVYVIKVSNKNSTKTQKLIIK
ncbi:T9SS type A sorting domain-containing protein [Psychroserpens sp.]|uniref:T9SS type A sorting domain-containing protein n=1 Tax=Psychroserpens sp. TaxID=2020870 RepID=UPI002B27A640|nr:T9SS type A sorting domain-containing protein [Psychroserpens sp.]